MNELANTIQHDRRWFLTWTTYGTWLPGDRRGFIGTLRDQSGQLVNHNQFGTPPAIPNSRLREAAERSLKAEPILLTSDHADTLFGQFQETARVRGWLLIATGIMRTHLHVIIAVQGDPDPEKILADFKAYGSRSLNQRWQKPASETWWTSKGSKRKLDDRRGVETVVHYIRNQPNPLLIWTREDGFLVGDELKK